MADDTEPPDDTNPDTEAPSLEALEKAYAAAQVACNKARHAYIGAQLKRAIAGKALDKVLYNGMEPPVYQPPHIDYGSVTPQGMEPLPWYHWQNLLVAATALFLLFMAGCGLVANIRWLFGV